MVLNKNQHHHRCRGDDYPHHSAPLDNTRCLSMLALTNQYILCEVIWAWRAVIL